MKKKKKTSTLNQYLLIDKYWPQYVIISCLIILISFLFPQGKSLQYVFQLNDVTQEPIIAPFTFPILKSDKKLKKDLDERRKSIPSVFNRDDKIVELQSSALSSFFSAVQEMRQANWRLEESKRLVYERRYHKQYEKAQSEFISDSTNLSLISKNFFINYPFTLEKKNWDLILKTVKDPKNLNDLEKNNELVLQICRNRWTEGIYDISIENINTTQVNVNQGMLPVIADPHSFNDLEKAWIKSKKELLSSFNDEDPFLDLGYDLIIEFMKPNLLFDYETTNRRQKESLDKVPRSQGVVLENELIVDANMRITDDVLLKLNSLSAAISKSDRASGILKGIQGLIGRIMILSVIISLFFAFLVVYRITIFQDWKMVLLISIVFLVQIALANIVVIQAGWSEYLIPVTMGAMTLTILFDARIGFMATTSLAIFMGIMMGQNIDLVIVSLFTATIAVYNIRELRKRSQLFTTMFALIGASVLVIIGLGLFKENSWSIMFRDIQFLALNSILAPILTYGLIGVFEMIFEVTTDLTLIELLDYDNPSSKRGSKGN